jgi:hypothetical protein
VEPDLDDTVSPGRSAPAAASTVDLDDTVIVRRSTTDGAPAGAPHDDTVIVAPAPGSSVPPPTPRSAPVAPQVPATTPPPVEPSPPRYGFRIGPSGSPVLLHTAVYVGRSPRSPRIATGAPPTLVTVASPHGEVSGTHLEIRQLGASVIVTDLRSTNGSSVAVPGSAPHTLRQGESMVVSPGTLVDIGDGNVIEILPLQRRPHDG